MSAYSSAVGEMVEYLKPVLAHVTDLALERLATQPGACDFRFGNPQEMPLPAIERAIVKWAAPQNKDWFAYKFSDPKATEVAVESLRERVGIEFDRRDIAMTTGAFGALATTLRAVLDPGDEVIYLSPPWFFYVPMILSCGARPVRVDFQAPEFALPVEAIAAAMTERTRAIIVNTPHNPSGRVLNPDELRRLADVLGVAPRPVYLVSDESYSRILFDSRVHESPLRFYDRSFLIYTYGKTLLAPGQRIGYIAMPPSMPDRESLRDALLVSQVALGWTFPNAVMQYAMGDLEQATIDVLAMQQRRDRIVVALTEIGYEVVKPEGTFYVMVRSPLTDELAFMQLLAQQNVFVLPGSMFELPGWFRISLTANDDMVERSLAGFARAFDESRVGNAR